LPGTQYAADTTDLEAFGVPLKLIATQDIGGRDDALFDAVIVDESESAAQVADVIKSALHGREGAQVITDQGTPYMADASRRIMDALDVEHAPQKEGDPTGKATVERAFGTVKSILGPMLLVSNRLADSVPALKQGALAKPFARVCIAMILRAWQQGARAARAAIHARGDIKPEKLDELAKASRERAVARERSARLLLAHVHEIYDLGRSSGAFIRAFKGYPLSVLRGAERAFRAQLHRDDLRSRSAYFAAIVRRLWDEHKHARARRLRDHANFEAQRVETEQRRHIEAQRAADPGRAMGEALELMALQWRPAEHALLFNGEGLGLGRLRVALRRLFELHPTALAEDIANGRLHEISRLHEDTLGPPGIVSLTSLARREIGIAKARHDHCTIGEHATILPLTRLEQRQNPSTALRS
jgi:hypothetical protein